MSGSEGSKATLDVQTSELPELRSGKMQHAHALHLAYRCRDGKRWNATRHGCEECGKLYGGFSASRAVPGDRPNCPACLESIE